MNAAQTAMEQARRYWQEQGVCLDGYSLAAQQAPLIGSVWWISACSPACRYDVLVNRLGKRSFHCVPHCPWGYTLYVCHKSGETPLEVVEYEEQALYRVGALRQTQRYRGSSLTYLANPSAEWRDAITASLAGAAQHMHGRHAERVEAYRTARHETHIEPHTGEPRRWHLPPLSYNDLLLSGSQVQALLTTVFDLLLHAFEQQGITCAEATQRSIRSFLSRRITGTDCQPWGCMWTVKRCLLLVPGEASSRYELTCWDGWKWGQAYSLWFDGAYLRECTYEELGQLLA